jgi:PAS domain S-box-containing protein
MAGNNPAPSFVGDPPAAAGRDVLLDRRELGLVAVERTRMPMIITDPKQPDDPIVLANGAFLELTGYTAEEVIGKNCRFLQGPKTDPKAIDAIRSGLRCGDERIDIELINYRKDGSTFWNQLSISPIQGESGELLYYFASQKDVTVRRQAQNHEASERRLLMEVDHRAMNALTLVQSIVRLSRTDSVERFAVSIQGRVDALARAHQLLAQSCWTATDLAELIALEADAGDVRCSGPAVSLASRLVQPLCLVLHELFANAREHGGLSAQGGSVAVTWKAEPSELVLEWSEMGVQFEPPPASGLGLGLVKSITEQQLGGRLAMDWRIDGLTAELKVPWQR